LIDIAKKNNGLAIRFGGEEFILFLPLSLDETYEAVTQTAQSLSEISFQHGSATFSAGIAENRAERSQEELLKCADNLMYQAKNNDRNCIFK
jgi:diguanylate cyclase (GGDEF)-like protein